MTSKPDEPPTDIETRVRKELELLTEELGEHAIGGSRHPKASDPLHLTSDLEIVRQKGRDSLIERLKEWSPPPGPERVQLLVYLWQESWNLWDSSLAYRTLELVREAAKKFVDDATGSGTGQPREGWEPDALRAVGHAMRLITADADVFKQINLSSADGLRNAAEAGVKTTGHIRRDISSALASLGPSPLAAGLGKIEDKARQNNVFYSALVYAAEALIKFESWLATAPRLGSAQPSRRRVALRRPRHSRLEVLASIDAAIDHFRDAREELGKVIPSRSEPWERLVILSRSEPWERLLAEVREIVHSSEDKAALGRVFVPKRASIRYCYPFAVEANDQTRDRLDKLRKDELEKVLGKIGIKVGEPEPLTATLFFDPDSGLYGGCRVDLGAIKIRYEQPSAANSGRQEERCKVWINLCYPGNHCLCIEPEEELDTPLPHVLYRALRAGTPFALGATASVADLPAGTEVAWDDLQSFSRDVIKAIVYAEFWPTEKDLPAAKPEERFVLGNLHEIVIVRTDAPLGTHPKEIADALDRAVGGRILARSIQRTATTLEEWVRYPPVPRTGRRDTEPAIAGMPEMGLAGDWCTHTGETSVFGIVAAPSWHSDVYVEAAQFVSSWSPLLRLWGRRLLNAIQIAQLDSDRESDSENLRHIEGQVRLHLAQTKAEELTATLAHRRFLDQLLEMAGLDRLQGELEAQLGAAERFTDWFNERARQKADQRRQVLLGIIALFAIFEVGTFLSIANTTGFHLFTLREGAGEDWLMVVLFGLALVLAVVYFFNVSAWVRRPVRAVARKFKRNKSDEKAGRLCRHEYPHTDPRPAGRRAWLGSVRPSGTRRRSRWTRRGRRAAMETLRMGAAACADAPARSRSASSLVLASMSFWAITAPAPVIIAASGNQQAS
jgi:hypothetical protein